MNIDVDKFIDELRQHRDACKYPVNYVLEEAAQVIEVLRDKVEELQRETNPNK